MRESGLEEIRATLTPRLLAVSAMSPMVFVLPDPEKATIRSPSPMAGVMVSPTT